MMISRSSAAATTHASGSTTTAAADRSSCSRAHSLSKVAAKPTEGTLAGWRGLGPDSETLEQVHRGRPVSLRRWCSSWEVYDGRALCLHQFWRSVSPLLPQTWVAERMLTQVKKSAATSSTSSATREATKLGRRGARMLNHGRSLSSFSLRPQRKTQCKRYLAPSSHSSSRAPQLRSRRPAASQALSTSWASVCPRFLIVWRWLTRQRSRRRCTKPERPKVRWERIKMGDPIPRAAIVGGREHNDQNDPFARPWSLVSLSPGAQPAALGTVSSSLEPASREACTSARQASI